MRKLASIQKIIDLQPIEGADMIEVATVLGWKVVVKKGEFKVGEKCVYFEIDSFLPARSEFAFLKELKTITTEDGKEHIGYRLRTIKLRKQISQGLALPIATLLNPSVPNDNWKEGADVTEELGVIKYEKYIQRTKAGSSRVPIVFPDWLPVKIGFLVKKRFPKIAQRLWGLDLKPFPSFIPKTDEERMQNVPNVLSRHLGKPFYITEKLDGSSITVFYDKGQVGVCSRNLQLPRDVTDRYWKAVIELNLEDKLKRFKENIALQGELVGEGVQDNKLKLTGNKIYFYSAYRIDTGKYCDLEDLISLSRILEIELVPMIVRDAIYTTDVGVDNMVKFATRKSVITPEVEAEGIVVRPIRETQDQELGRLSFKVINPEWLLSFKE